jgi:hypothetical protein
MYDFEIEAEIKSFGSGIRIEIQEYRENGGARENRTPNLLIANQTLCQLSYSPGYRVNYYSCPSYIPSINGPYLSSTNFLLILKLGVISPDSIEKA